MKKILSLALASVLALGMTVTAFALKDQVITGGKVSISGLSGLKVDGTFTVTLADVAADMASAKGMELTINAVDDATGLPAAATDFTYTSAAKPTALTSHSWTVTAKKAGTFNITADVEGTAVISSSTYAAVVVAPKTSSSTVITGKIVGWNTTAVIVTDTTGSLDKYYVNQAIEFPISVGNFAYEDADGNAIVPNKLTTAILSKASVKFALKGTNASKFTLTVKDNANGDACVVLVPKVAGDFAGSTLLISVTGGTSLGSTTIASTPVANTLYVVNGEVSGTKITEQVESLDINYATVNKGVDVVNPLSVEVFADDELYIPLTADMFGINNNGIGDKSPVTQQIIRDGKVEVRTAIASGSKAIKSVALDYKNFSDITTALGSVKTATIIITMVDPFVSIDEVDFALDVYLVIDGGRTSYKDLGMRIEGTLTFNTTLVYANDTSVDLYNGEVAEAMEYNKEITADLGNGVSIVGKMFKGKKYYGIAKGEADDTDLVVFDKYPDVDRVFSLYTVGLNSTGNKIKLDLTGDVFYIYNKDMEFIGMSNEMLVYSTKYYVSNKKLDVADATEVEEPEEETPTTTTNPETGGNNAPSNANNNPSTGC